MNPRLKAGGAAGAVTTIVVFVAARLGLEVPPEVASALTVLIYTGAGYLKEDA
jgi:nanoRNase/pAp phosphatase (c-di-AMP/oligoRNAs hydrolase)